MVLASVDEWTITYKNGLSYSWGRKGQELELNTLPYQGSISLILWILSNGLYFWTIIQNYVNSDIFTQFLSYFEVWMSKQATILGKRVLWLLDNCSSHRSKDALLIMKNSNIDYLFIPCLQSSTCRSRTCIQYTKKEDKQIKFRQNYQAKINWRVWLRIYRDQEFQ